MRQITKNLLENLNKDYTGLTIKEYAINLLGGYIDTDVTDTDIDMLVAFSFDFNEDIDLDFKAYGDFMNLIAERTKIVRVNGDILVCNFSEVFKPYEDKLRNFFDMENSEFDEAYYEAVDNLEDLISGNAGDSTYNELVSILNGKQITNEASNLESIIDEDNAEDVTGVEPIGVYTVSNNSAIYVYQIEYDIEDKVLVGDSSDETKAIWRDIIYGDGEAYFWYGDIKVPFNDVVRTDI